MAPEALDHRLGIGPGAVPVGVVDLHHDVLHPYGVAGLDGRGVVDGAEPEVATQHVRRADVPAHAVPGAVDDVVEAVDEHGHPADAPLGHGQLEIGVAQGPARPEPARFLLPAWQDRSGPARRPGCR